MPQAEDDSVPIDQRCVRRWLTSPIFARRARLHFLLVVGSLSCPFAMVNTLVT